MECVPAAWWRRCPRGRDRGQAAAAAAPLGGSERVGGLAYDLNVRDADGGSTNTDCPGHAGGHCIALAEIEAVLEAHPVSPPVCEALWEEARAVQMADPYREGNRGGRCRAGRVLHCAAPRPL